MRNLVKAAIGVTAVLSSLKLIQSLAGPKTELQGKTALITGGSRGLGLALAKEFGQHGCRVLLCARDRNELERAVDQLTQLGIKAASFVCDVTSEGEVAAMLAEITAQFGGIDILINNAGIITVAPLESLEQSDFEAAMQLMFWAPLRLTFAVMPHMRKQGSGCIVNITSIGGRVSVPRLLPYSSAKFALVGFSTGLGVEAYRHGIHVVTVVPGLMRTGSYVSAEFKGLAEKEFAWFSLLGNAPGFSVSVSHAARSIRKAVERKQQICNISLPAKMMIAAEALLPELNRSSMKLMDSLLMPKATGDKLKLAGKTLVPSFGPVFQALTVLGKQAAREYNQ